MMKSDRQYTSLCVDVWYSFVIFSFCVLCCITMRLKNGNDDTWRTHVFILYFFCNSGTFQKAKLNVRCSMMIVLVWYSLVDVCGVAVSIVVAAHLEIDYAAHAMCWLSYTHSHCSLRSSCLIRYVMTMKRQFVKVYYTAMYQAEN